MKNNGWKSYLRLEIVEKNEQICTVKFQNFLGAMTQTPILGRAYGAPPQIPLAYAEVFVCEFTFLVCCCFVYFTSHMFSPGVSCNAAWIILTALCNIDYIYICCTF